MSWGCPTRKCGAVPQSCCGHKFPHSFLTTFFRLPESLLPSIVAYRLQEIGHCDHQLRANAGEVQAAARILHVVRQDVRDAAGMETRSTGCKCGVANLRRRLRLSAAPQLTTERRKPAYEFLLDTPRLTQNGQHGEDPQVACCTAHPLHVIWRLVCA